MSKKLTRKDVKEGGLIWINPKAIYVTFGSSRFRGGPAIISKVEAKNCDWFKVCFIGENLKEFDFQFKTEELPACIGGNQIFHMRGCDINEVIDFFKKEKLEIEEEIKLHEKIIKKHEKIIKKNKKQFDIIVKNNKEIIENVIKMQTKLKDAGQNKHSTREEIMNVTMNNGDKLEIDISDEACGKFTVDGKALKHGDRFFDKKILEKGSVRGVTSKKQGNVKKGVLCLSLDCHNGKAILLDFDSPGNILNENFTLI